MKATQLRMTNVRLVVGILALLFAQAALAQSNQTVFATGFNNPRGLKFGPEGNLYVAEGGAGGGLSTVGLCDQAAGLPAGPGPYTGAYTARISKIAPNGTVTTVADGLPSSQTSAAFGNLVSGVSDVAFVDGHLYALLAGAGCSHGLLGTSNGVLRINHDGTWTQIADLSAFQMSHPVANPEPDDFEPDGVWYSMVALDDTLFAVEPNHGEVDAVSVDGHIRRVADISNVQGHIVPTSIAYRHGAFYVGNLDTFPVKDSSKVMKITLEGKITTVAIDFETIVGLAFDTKGRLYVLENTTDNAAPTPGTGKILRIDGKHRYTEITTGLNLPTAMTFGPDGNLYVSTWGFGPPPVGLGTIVKVTVP